MSHIKKVLKGFTSCTKNSETAISFATENTDGVVSFNWTNDNSDTGLTETAGAGDVPVFNATNNTNEPIVLSNPLTLVSSST